MDNHSTMEASTAAVSHGDVTFDTEEADNVSEMSSGIPKKDHNVAANKQQDSTTKSKVIKIRDTGGTSTKPKKLWTVVVVLALIVGILLF